MTATLTHEKPAGSHYVLGWSDAEQDRLIRQAMILAPLTERLFREAGIGTGQRVLDVGSGVGDVAMLAARLVGPSGEVLGLERNAGYIARATERVSAVGFRNVTFVQADLNDLTIDGLFDAAIGRLILNHLPDPVAVVRAVSRLVAPGGVIAFAEPTWSSTLAVSAAVPLWSQLMTTLHEIFTRSRGTTREGLELYRIFQDAGLRAPTMHLEMPLGDDARFAEVETDLLRALLPAAEEHGVSVAELGDLDTLAERVHAALVQTKAPICFVGMVSAWSRKTA
jgi:ubiquinone/menaquinone biosynthesis C-methylase UbiE